MSAKQNPIYRRQELAKQRKKVLDELVLSLKKEEYLTELLENITEVRAKGDLEYVDTAADHKVARSKIYTLTGHKRKLNTELQNLENEIKVLDRRNEHKETETPKEIKDSCSTSSTISKSGTPPPIKKRSVQLSLFNSRFNTTSWNMNASGQRDRRIDRQFDPKYNNVAVNFSDKNFPCTSCEPIKHFQTKTALISHQAGAHAPKLVASVLVEKQKNTPVRYSKQHEKKKYIIGDMKVESKMSTPDKQPKSKSSPPKIKSENNKMFRQVYTTAFKLKTANLYHYIKESSAALGRTNVLQNVARISGTSEKNISRWASAKEMKKFNDQIYKKVVGRGNKKVTRVFKIRNKFNSILFPVSESLLHEWFLDKRAQGFQITSYVLRVKMKQYVTKEIKTLEGTILSKKQKNFCASPGWAQKFRGRYGIVPRAKTKIKATFFERVPKCQRFHIQLHNRLKRNPVDSEYGRWKPCHRYNVDQVPLPLQCGGKLKTLATRGEKIIWMKQREGSNKRAATLQMCIHLGEVGIKQPKACILFRGQGKRLSQEEKESWDPRVIVRFQKNAWADDKFCVEWAEQNLAEAVKHHNNGECVLFMDNLVSQKSVKFLEVLKKLNVKSHFFPAGCTDLLQPIDRNIGAQFKYLIGLEQELLFEADDALLDRWCGIGGTMPAKECRILLTKCVAEAWHKMCNGYTDRLGKWHHPMDFSHIGKVTGCNMKIGPLEEVAKSIALQGIQSYTLDASMVTNLKAESGGESEEEDDEVNLDITEEEALSMDANGESLEPTNARDFQTLASLCTHYLKALPTILNSAPEETDGVFFDDTAAIVITLPPTKGQLGNYSKEPPLNLDNILNRNILINHCEEDAEVNGWFRGTVESECAADALRRGYNFNVYYSKTDTNDEFFGSLETNLDIVEYGIDSSRHRWVLLDNIPSINKLTSIFPKTKTTTTTTSTGKMLKGGGRSGSISNNNTSLNKGSSSSKNKTATTTTNTNRLHFAVLNGTSSSNSITTTTTSTGKRMKSAGSSRSMIKTATTTNTNRLPFTVLNSSRSSSNSGRNSSTAKNRVVSTVPPKRRRSDISDLTNIFDYRPLGMKGTAIVTQGDYARLTEGFKLNDNIINFYSNFLKYQLIIDGADMRTLLQYVGNGTQLKIKPYINVKFVCAPNAASVSFKALILAAVSTDSTSGVLRYPSANNYIRNLQPGVCKDVIMATIRDLLNHSTTSSAQCFIDILYKHQNPGSVDTLTDNQKALALKQDELASCYHTCNFFDIFVSIQNKCSNECHDMVQDPPEMFKHIAANLDANGVLALQPAKITSTKFPGHCKPGAALCSFGCSDDKYARAPQPGCAAIKEDRHNCDNVCHTSTHTTTDLKATPFLVVVVDRGLQLETPRIANISITDNCCLVFTGKVQHKIVEVEADIYRKTVLFDYQLISFACYNLGGVVNNELSGHYFTIRYLDNQWMKHDGQIQSIISLADCNNYFQTQVHSIFMIKKHPESIAVRHTIIPAPSLLTTTVCAGVSSPLPAGTLSSTAEAHNRIEETNKQSVGTYFKN